MTHPNIVNLLDVGIENGARYLVIEYVSGTSLKDMIRHDGALPPDKAANIAIRILAALSHAHEQGIIHRDIKPQNILMDKTNLIKVLDFGIARVVGQPGDPNVQESAIGSVHYFSPEQARGELADEKSDIYSVGVVLYEMLTGKKPFSGDNQVAVAIAHLEDKPVPPMQINSNVPIALARVVMRAMEKDPDKRYPNAKAMAGAIRQALHFPNVPAPEPKVEKKDTPEQIEIKQRRLRHWRRAITITFTALLSVVIVLLILSVARNVLRAMLDRVIMPTVTNMSYAAASELLESKGLVIHKTERIVEIGTEGLVVDQSPEPGALLQPGGEVLLTVSVSEYDMIMPDLTHQTLTAALAVIRESRLTISVQEIVASEAREGLVIEQVPAPGVKVRYGQPVVLRISGGLVIVPNFVSMPEQTAMASVTEALTLSEVKLQTVNDSNLDGVVIAQDPEAYTRVTLGERLTLTVGRLEPRIYTGEASVRLSLESDSLIKATLVKADGTEELQYCAIHPKGYSDANFLVRADQPGTYTCNVYEEDQFVRSISVDLK
jgi:serine/threonine-protein kinase